uniref:Uncharacterized protein n=1 Tax=Cacopsylla melanoneura TaxID=428564 RepID=A0A8D9AVR0_9HEMI
MLNPILGYFGNDMWTNFSSTQFLSLRVLDVFAIIIMMMILFNPMITMKTMFKGVMLVLIMMVTLFSMMRVISLTEMKQVFLFIMSLGMNMLQSLVVLPDHRIGMAIVLGEGCNVWPETWCGGKLLFPVIEFSALVVKTFSFFLLFEINMWNCLLVI